MCVSWKPEVMVSGESKWCGNALRFASKEEAEGNVKALMWKWLAVNEVRVVESEEPVNYRWVEGKLVSLN